MVTFSSAWSCYTIPFNVIGGRRSISDSHSSLSRTSFPNFNLLTQQKKRTTNAIVNAKLAQETELQYRKLGDSDLNISEITIGTVSSFGISALINLILLCSRKCRKLLCLLMLCILSNLYEFCIWNFTSMLNLFCLYYGSEWWWEIIVSCYRWHLESRIQRKRLMRF